ncbi:MULTISPECIES: DUF397 domain-containing protein [unclassified Streptomyces]|uniref:DUF397 domain-containing protein n=1 Tax=unclassified Streptomyces TaxID=2593676 RepID=UPI0033D788A6
MIGKASVGDAPALEWFKSSYSSGNEGDSCVEIALEWCKSSYSSSSETDDCVEVAQEWHKSSYSSSGDGNDCVEVAPTPHTIHIRDSKTPGRPHLTLAPSAWSTFLPYASRNSQA